MLLVLFPVTSVGLSGYEMFPRETATNILLPPGNQSTHTLNFLSHQCLFLCFSQGQQQNNKVLRIGRGKQIYCCLLQFDFHSTHPEVLQLCFQSAQFISTYSRMQNATLRGGGRQSEERETKWNRREEKWDKGRSWGEIVLVSECSRAWRMKMLIFIFTPRSALRGRTCYSRPISVDSTLHNREGILLCGVICHLMTRMMSWQCAESHYRCIG